MAVTNLNSTQYALQVGPGTEIDHPYHGRVKCMTFEFAQGAVAGDATSTATLIRLPAGKIMILTKLSQIEFSAFGASRTLDVGYAAYTNLSATAVAAAPAYLASAVDVSSAGSMLLNESTTPTMSQYIETRDGLVLNATVAGGTIPAAATIKGYILYVNA